MQDFRIVPKPIEQCIDRLVIHNVQVRLFKEAVVMVHMYSENQLVQQTAVLITESEYKQWGADDQYLLECITSKLGFSLQPETKDVSGDMELPQSS